MSRRRPTSTHARYMAVSDDSGHWYVIRAEAEDAWSEWLEGDDLDEVPDWAERINNWPITFTDPRDSYNEPLCRDKCEVCKGASGGVPGNENIADGKIMCDYCHARTLPPSIPRCSDCGRNKQGWPWMCPVCEKDVDPFD